MKIRMFFRDFFSGLFWPFRWLGSFATSIGALIALCILIFVGSISALLSILWFAGYTSSNSSNYETSTNITGDCNVIGIHIRGCLTTYISDAGTSSLGASSGCDTTTASSDVVDYLQAGKESNQIKAVLLSVDSPGGLPAAAEEMNDAIKAFGKPSIALINGYGDSAAYWTASAADTVIAGRESDIGSIGVTESYVDNAKQDEQNGLTYNQISTGPYKDMGSPDKPLTADERAYLERGLQTTYEDFIQAVATNRHLSLDTVRALADGSSILGVEALHDGLIDQIGTEQTAFDALQKKLGDKPIICWQN